VNTSISHRERVKSILNGFAEWLINEELMMKHKLKQLSL
jgi:hypothetical protein